MSYVIDPNGVLSTLSENGLLSDSRIAELTRLTQHGSEPSDDEILEQARRRGWLTPWQCDQIRNAKRANLRFGEFVLIEFVHRDRNARVFKARSLVDDRLVALKVLTSQGNSDPMTVARLHRDLEASRKVGSPWAVRCEGIDLYQGRPCLIREWIEGETLRQVVSAHGRYDRNQVYGLMTKMAQGLAAIHAAGLRHGAISADHIFLRSDGTPILFEFGWSTDLNAKSAPNGTCLAYRELEKATHAPECDPRTDAYFLGCVFYELLSGNSPHPELEKDHELQTLMVRTFGSEIPLTDISGPPKTDVARTVAKIMQFQPDRRLADPGEIVRRFERIALGQDPEIVTDKEPEAVDTAEMFAWLDGAAPSESTDESTSADDSQADRPIEGQGTVGCNVLCVEAQEEIQREFRKTFEKLGWKARMVRTTETAADMALEKPADIVIYDADGQGRESLDAFLQLDRLCSLGRNAAHGLLLLGPKQLKFESGLPDSIRQRYTILRKPLKMREVKNSLMLCAMK